MFRVERLQLRLVRLPLVAFFETSFARVYDKTFILVLLDGGGFQGLGECVADVDPYYSSETNTTAWHVIKDFIAPLVLGRTFEDPRDVFRSLARVRGHNMAKAAVEMAAWDLAARGQQVPLSRLLGGTRAEIASGVSIGIQDSLDDLAAKVRKELDAGYRLAALDRFDLMMIEQPLEYDDVRDHAALQRRIMTPICLDESIHSVRAAEEAIALEACRIVNIKPGRLGGHAESIRVHDTCAAHGIPVWHGGMLESGIGRAHNIHLASLPNFTLPGDIAASRRYFEPDLIEPGIEVSATGTVAVPTGPGIGVIVDWDRVKAATIETYDVRA